MALETQSFGDTKASDQIATASAVSNALDKKFDTPQISGDVYAMQVSRATNAEALVGSKGFMNFFDTDIDGNYIVALHFFLNNDNVDEYTIDIPRKDGTLALTSDIPSVDDALSDSSTNPVQNKVVKESVDALSTSIKNLSGNNIPITLFNQTHSMADWILYRSPFVLKWDSGTYDGHYVKGFFFNGIPFGIYDSGYDNDTIINVFATYFLTPSEIKDAGAQDNTFRSSPAFCRTISFSIEYLYYDVTVPSDFNATLIYTFSYYNGNTPVYTANDGSGNSYTMHFSSGSTLFRYDETISISKNGEVVLTFPSIIIS